MFEKIKEMLINLSSPSFWFRNYRTSEEWDEKLNKMMDNQEELEFPYLGFTAKFVGSNISVWTGNYPHAYGTPRKGTEVMPKRHTVRRLRKYIDRKRYGVDNTKLHVFLGYEKESVVKTFRNRATAESWCLQAALTGRSYEKVEVV